MTDKENRRCSVYKHTLPNGKYYIGATYRGKERWGKNGELYKNSSKIFYTSILQYGWNNIKHEILFSGLSYEQAREIEKKLINEAQEKGLSLNKVRGGYDIIDKNKLVVIAGLRQYGLSYREIGEILKCETSTASVVLYNKMYLKYFTEEEFLKEVSDFVKSNTGKYTREDGKTFNHNGVPSRIVIQKDKEGNIVAEYESITAAAQANNILHTSIVNNLKGRSKTCGGFIYEYKQD